MDENWQNQFRDEHNGRDPDRHDRLIRLFSIAYPDEWNGEHGHSFFYNEDGTYKEESLATIFGASSIIPESRTWATLPDAVGRLAGWYKEDETEEFVRDIGTLFGGLRDRFDEPDLHIAVTGCEQSAFCDDRMRLPANDWLGVRPEGLPSYLTGGDWDANVHHWAWSLVLGYHLRALPAIAANTTREYEQAKGTNPYDNPDSSADIWLGNRGALMGATITGKSVSSDKIHGWFQFFIYHGLR